MEFHKQFQLSTKQLEGSRPHLIVYCIEKVGSSQIPNYTGRRCSIRNPPISILQEWSTRAAISLRWKHQSSMWKKYRKMHMIKKTPLKQTHQWLLLNGERLNFLECKFMETNSTLHLNKIDCYAWMTLVSIMGFDDISSGLVILLRN